MKVAYFTESLPPLVDGVTRTLTRLADTLEKDQVPYRFYSPVKPDESIYWRDKVRKVASVPFPLYSYYRIGLPYFHGLWRELDAFKPDLLHVCSPTLLGLYALRYARGKNIPVVASYHTHFVSYFPYYGLEQMERVGWNYLHWFHNQCQRTFVPSNSTAEQLCDEGIANVTLWQRGIDLHHFSPQHRHAELRRSVGADDRPLLLYVGRLVKEKDLDDLVQAALYLNRTGCRYALVFIGTGPMQTELQKKLPFAHFIGNKQGHELAQWYASADLFVFPSTTETFGNVILEALASGTPAVGVAAGGVRDLIKSGVNGWLTRPKDPAHFGGALRWLLEDETSRKALAGRARPSVQKFDWDFINRRLLSDYVAILTHHTKRRAA
jgi:glycosyltransferase involved in cell wall biosynthesis